MHGTAAQSEADAILAELPDRISNVIKPFARRSPEHPALAQDDITGTYAELAIGSLHGYRRLHWNTEMPRWP